MKKDRKDLEKNLIVILERISGDENKMHIITDIMMQHGILPGEAAKMTEQPTSISLLDVNVLYLFTNALFEATKEIIIKPEDWFTEIQIAEGKAFQIYEDDKITEIVLHNVTYNGNKHWVCPRISGKELYSFIQHRLLGYDPQMQRPTIKFVTLETMGELPDIRTYKTSQITKQILNREFVGNTISLNIKKTGFEEYSYDEETMTLVIPIKVENSIVIIDGAHRIIGNAKAYQLDPNIDINWSLNIFNYDVKEARKFIKQD
jgi:hypothetical protein